MSERDIVERLRAGICQDKCRAMEARAGCECAEAADTIERQAAEIGRLREALETLRDEPDVLDCCGNWQRGSGGDPECCGKPNSYHADVIATALARAAPPASPSPPEDR